jgi:leader peptidase (prepilin peptidase) / N-methyltransferase
MMIWVLVGLFGLAVGSFLNVVIVRYPPMLARRWQTEAEHDDLQTPFNVVIPRSQCPHCRHPLPLSHNIPVVSYLMLRGRCGFCRQRISWQYPVVEIACALATIAVFLRFGWEWQTVAVWVLTWGLIVLSGIDWTTYLLPDDITLSLLWLGLLVNITAWLTPLPAAVAAAVIGYLLLWTTAAVFKLIRRKPGMGHGDFKMLAMLGAWLGVTRMLYALVIATVLSLIINLGLLLLKKIHFHQLLPFGPWLALAGWVVLMVTGP